MEVKNQLFIHPTDMCSLNCSFCIYSNNRADPSICAYLDLKKGHGAESLKNLIKGAQHTAFSGGGEPFLNTDAIVDSILLNGPKKYMITTGLGISLGDLEQKITKVNSACNQTQSFCVLRISVDSFHGNIDFGEELDTILRWFILKKWDRVRVCFIRGTMSEGKLLLKNLKKYCWKNHFICICKRINKYTYAVIIKGKFFQVILRPTIYPDINSLEKEETTLEYINSLFEIDEEEINLGKPRSCRGCKGCDSWKSGLSNGLDITVNAKGDIYLYGAEIVCLGNIYKEVISYELLNSRVMENFLLVKLQSFGIKKVMEAMLEDLVLGPLVKEVNYPFAVIRECMKNNKEDVFRVIESL